MGPVLKDYSTEFVVRGVKIVVSNISVDGKDLIPDVIDIKQHANVQLSFQASSTSDVLIEVCMYVRYSVRTQTYTHLFLGKVSTLPSEISNMLSDIGCTMTMVILTLPYLVTIKCALTCTWLGRKTTLGDSKGKMCVANWISCVFMSRTPLTGRNNIFLLFVIFNCCIIAGLHHCWQAWQMKSWKPPFKVLFKSTLISFPFRSCQHT